MVTVCWSAKGGSGTTLVAAMLALGDARSSLLVDLDGELPAALGIAEPDRPGVADWMGSDAPADHLADLLIALDGTTQLLPFRLGQRLPDSSTVDAARLPEVVGWLHDWERGSGGHVVIDAGTGEPHEAFLAAERSLLVTRNCYLAVSRASRAARPPGGIVMIDEPGRSLSARDIELAVGAPIIARLAWEAEIARAIDAGLLRGRIPRIIDRALRAAVA